MKTYQILSEDHVVEALTKYLREPPYKLDFDELQVVEFDLDFDGEYKVVVLLNNGPSNES